MFKQTIEYTDFNGENRKEDFYFHLSLPEVTRIEAHYGRTIADQAAYLAEKKNLSGLLEFIERVMLSSYGEKSPDGRTFVKNEELRSNFENSQAYAELFETLLTNPELGQRFGEQVADNGKKKNQVTPKLVE